MWLKLGLIAMAGGIGALARYGLAGVVQRFSGGVFPWGTIAVNILGCFLFGLLASAMDHRLNISPHVRLMILTGFMGAFTTFSTFAFETVGLLRDGQWVAACVNVAVQNLVGLTFLVVGWQLGRAV